MSNDITKETLNIVKEIRADVKDCTFRLTEIEKLDAIQNYQLKEHIRRTEALEAEVKDNRNFKWYFGGIAVIITAVSSVLAKILGVFI